MEKIIENLFFRYEAGELKNYSSKTLFQLPYYFNTYAHFLEKHPKKFISLLLDLPDPVFYYFYHRLQQHRNGSLFSSLDSIKKRADAILSNPLVTSLRESIDKSNGVIFTFPLKNILIVGLKKSNQRFFHTDDLVLYFNKGDINVIELLNDYRLDTFKPDDVFSTSLQNVKEEIEIFKNKNRLKLCFT